uniref:Uncharacterized protein n=1 Tax=Ananas comosus var. bracteatus TaxID=296719 RepID=A0A6V7PSD4_ANACO|nr:unnamed protein product [Ananas comosus var. bracteatus]
MFVSPRSSLIALLVPAMTNVHTALARLGLDGAMKVSSPIALTALRASYLPSAGAFPNDLGERVMRPMLDLLCHTGSYLMVNAYTFFAYSADAALISLDYGAIRPDTGLVTAHQRLEEPKFDAGSAVDEHLDVVPRGLHPIYVDKSQRRYLVSSDLIDHPLFRVLIEHSDRGEGMSSVVIIVREVVLLEHLLQMLRNVGVHPSRVDVQRLRTLDASIKQALWVERGDVSVRERAQVPGQSQDRKRPVLDDGGQSSSKGPSRPPRSRSQGHGSSGRQRSWGPRQQRQSQGTPQCAICGGPHWPRQCEQ